MRRFYTLSFLPLWLLFWVITALLYGIAWRSGFERDFHGWFQMYHSKSFADLLNRKGLGITSLYQGTQLQLWAWTKLFGTHLIPWFLLQTSLYAAAAALLTTFFRKFYVDFGWRRALPVAFWGSLFALVAPHNAEIVVWKASYHYPVAVLLLVGVLFFFRKAILENSGKSLFWALLLYAFSTFTLELFYATLPLAALMAVLYFRKKGAENPFYKQQMLIGLSAMLGLFLFHFLLYRLIYNGYIPHQQEDLEILLAAPTKGFGHFFQDEFHLLFQGRYWPIENRLAVYQALGSTTGGVVAMILLALVGISMLLAALRWQRFGPLALLVTGALIGALMIVSYWVPDFGLYYNDRYLYFTSLFQWQIVAVLLFRAPRPAATALAVLLTLALSIITLYTALQLRRSAKIFWRLMEDYRWKAYDKGPVILLNTPAHYKGIFIYQESPDGSDLNSHLQIYTGDSARIHPQVVAGYHMEDTTDGVRVLAESDSVFYVTLIRPGLWYWNRTLGASDHENNLYKMKLDEWSHQYKLTLKDTSALLLYFNRGRWHEVDKAKRGVEQE